MFAANFAAYPICDLGQHAVVKLVWPLSGERGFYVHIAA